MINYRKGKERFKPNELGSLYVEKDTLKGNERPVIYVGRQMEHRCHVLEQTGLTGDPGHNLFNGSWFYDYPVFKGNKNEINAQNMTANLLKALELANLGEVDLVTESFGGLIAAYASLSDRIHKIYAVHPPITGTPLANPEMLKKYEELFSKQEKLIRLILGKLINTDYGFERDNFNGADLGKVDLNKLLVIGSSLDLKNEKNALAVKLYEMIMKVTGYKSDGVVVFDKDLFAKKGINYLEEAHGLNHFDAGSESHLTAISNIIRVLNTDEGNQVKLEYLELLKWRLTYWLLYEDSLSESRNKNEDSLFLALLLKDDDLSPYKEKLATAILKGGERESHYWCQFLLNTVIHKLELSKSQGRSMKPIEHQ